MFAGGRQILSYLPDVFAPIGEKHHQFPVGFPAFPGISSPPVIAWLLIVGLYKTEAFGRRNRILFSASKGHHAPVRNGLDKAFLVSCPHVAAVKSPRQGTIREGQIGILFGFDRIRLPLFANSASIRSATACRCSRSIS